MNPGLKPSDPQILMFNAIKSFLLMLIPKVFQTVNRSLTTATLSKWTDQVYNMTGQGALLDKLLFFSLNARDFDSIFRSDKDTGRQLLKS